MPEIEILVGMIASGKSTYTTRRANEGRIVLNGDTLNTSLHGGNYLIYEKELEPLYKCLPLVAACMGVAAGRYIVVDNTNLTKSVRSRWIGMARMLNISARVTVFEMETPEIHAQRRFEHDSRGYDYEYWLKIARAHEAKYEPVDKDEGFLDISYWKHTASE